MIQLGSWIPFPSGAKILAHLTKIDVSEPTVRRGTERAGQAYVEIQTEQVELLEKELPDAPEGPAVQQVSVDGAMVSLTHKEWAEVKTLAIGTVEDKGKEIHTKDLSYFSRLADNETFTRLATVETHRRGTENAGLVCAIVDGAEWEQKFIDMHCPNAVRILDWGHAAEYVARAGQAVFGSGTESASQWIGQQLHELKHGDSQRVLGKLRGIRDELAAQGEGKLESEPLKVVTTSLEYLEKRRDQIRYAEFIAAGYPIGSGIVESANKLVVEVRLKGAGMHWAREHVNPMVALRTVVCSDRWEEIWPQISERLRRAREGSVKQRAKQRQAEDNVVQPVELVSVRAEQVLKQPKAAKLSEVKVATNESGAVRKAWRPSDNHPWRRRLFGRRQRRDAS